MGCCTAKVTSSRLVESSIYPGLKRRAYSVLWAEDNTTQELEEEELRPLIHVGEMPDRVGIVDALAQAFNYLEARITGAVDIAAYSCEHMYGVSFAPSAHLSCPGPFHSMTYDSRVL